MAKNGMPDDRPLPCGAAVADHSGAIALMAGVLAALYAREKTGKGQKVDALYLRNRDRTAVNGNELYRD